MALVIIFLIIAVDQVTKFIAKTELINHGNINIIHNLFSLTYVENRGAAFGIFRGMKFVLIGITSFIVILMIIYLLKNKNLNKYLRISFILIIGGAIGNLIDRIYLGYVVDFFHIFLKSYFDFPVFNVADICVVIGTILVAINIIFSKD